MLIKRRLRSGLLLAFKKSNDETIKARNGREISGSHLGFIMGFIWGLIWGE